ncbi:16S rRNA (cytidine1402-2'-O)-methyltransferase [Allocatelliglobosispora scoriae]|uniref:Ribosomal RNA small subunit methyltransferase I n=1 Tax=Allocatelliglobosispora scoriae TaxID=643052 RepID=A0A841BUL8_9ACTN|nr:16S rRNA (cytidine(1402)-2'-O)-methyltransferase [Allocatelliglobosispora scoriae]MBB5870460.1 16S rRNA (cytidine1402-2'-O)-methyltransferase [Allocatelliglobosispora scoriae]
MLILCGAPLGNVGDASTRLRESLAAADIVAAEDTRRLHRLAKDLSIVVNGRIVSYFEGNEERRTPELVAAMEGGARVALITDGGMPSVSDPGYRLVSAALAAGLPVSCVPGPSAVTTALALSGLPCDRFCFEGFLPRTGGARRTRLAELAAEQRTLVFFESPHRAQATLADLAAAFGPGRAAALCRELTKTYEEVRRAGLAELAALDGWKGEITIVVAGANPADAPRPTDEQLRSEVADRVATGESRRDAITAVATIHHIPRKDLYSLIH